MEALRKPMLGALAALAFGITHLAIEALSGGIVSHHLLADPDLPAIHNGFGLLLLPVLGWLVGLRFRRAEASVGGIATARFILLGFGLALLYGVALAATWSLGGDEAASRLFFALFALAVLAPLYRVECLAGFVIGMTFTFGAVLPLLFGGVVALASLALHVPARLLIRRLRRSAAA